ncbi:hypothetical protein F5Y02DRAFT_379231, partial [Annulohypoxylon stygium]
MTNKATAAIGTTTATAILAGSAMAPDCAALDVITDPEASVEVAPVVDCAVLVFSWVEVTVMNAVLPFSFVLCCVVMTVTLGVVDVGVVVVVEDGNEV